MRKSWQYAIVGLVLGIALGAASTWLLLKNQNGDDHRILLNLEGPNGANIDAGKIKFSKPGTLKRILYGDISYRWEYEFQAKPGETVHVDVSEIPNNFLAGSADFTVAATPRQMQQIQLRPDQAKVHGRVFRPNGKLVSGIIVALSEAKELDADAKTVTENTGTYEIPTEIQKGQRIRLSLIGHGCSGSDVYLFTGKELNLYCP